MSTLPNCELRTDINEVQLPTPLESLQNGNWFKLICGASYQHLPAIRSLTLAYAIAGADCIDVAADPAVIAAARNALDVLPQWRTAAPPLLMVSLNDGEDPHFRKARFDPQHCPPHCPRPCEAICPASAIAFDPPTGVIESRCYGCGRCLPACPYDRITTHARSLPLAQIRELDADAIEIHTQVGREREFRRLWSAIAPLIPRLHVLAISCPDGPNLVEYLRHLHAIVSPLPGHLIWQTDGRPMSGDLGKGSTRASIKLAQKVLAAQLPGYIQLAGGTNEHTVPKLRAARLLAPNRPRVAGVAYGSYARSLLAPLLDRCEQEHPGNVPLEASPEILWEAVTRALALVTPLKEAPHQTQRAAIELH